MPVDVLTKQQALSREMHISMIVDTIRQTNCNVVKQMIVISGLLKCVVPVKMFVKTKTK